MENCINNPLIKPKKEVNYQFKILYVMMMSVVLCGHMGCVPSFIPWTEMFSAYGFGIQLFMFISGYFYSKSNDLCPGKFIVKKIRKILIPYLLWNLFYGAICYILCKNGFDYHIDFSWKNFLITPIVDSPAFLFNSPTWFLLPFFLAEIFTVIERWLLKKFDSYKKDIFLITINFIISFAGIYISMKGYNEMHYYEGKWRFLTRAMFMLPYYSLGYIYKTYIEKHDKIPSRWYFLILLGLQLLYILWRGTTSSYFVVVMGGFENPITPIITSILGIAFYLRIARVLTPVIGRTKWVNAIADNTFAIMVHHMFGYFILCCIFLLCTKIIPFLPEFDLNSFMNRSDYYYMPRNTGFPILYVVFSFAFSIYFKKMLDVLYNFIKSKIFTKKEVK